MRHMLLIMRHGKSSWDDPSLDDKVRPLNPRGEHDAPMMGRRIQKLGYQCNCIISSPAIRAMMTAQSVADAVGFKNNILLDDALYMQGLEEMKKVLAELDEGIENVMLFGHNPDMHELYEKLSGHRINKFPTAAFALFELNSSWKTFTQARELHFDKPKS